MLIHTPGAELLGHSTAVVLSALATADQSLSLKQLVRRAKLKRSTVGTTVDRLVALGLVQIDADAEIVHYTLNRNHTTWSTLSGLLAADKKVYQAIRELVDPQGENEISVAVAGPAPEPAADDHTIHVLIVFPNELSIDIRHELGNAIIRTLSQATGSVIRVNICRHRELDMRIQRGTQIDSARWMNSRTVHGPDVGKLIHALQGQREGGGSNRGS